MNTDRTEKLQDILQEVLKPVYEKLEKIERKLEDLNQEKK